MKKASGYIYRYCGQNWEALYHSITMDLIYIKKDLEETRKSRLFREFKDKNQKPTEQTFQVVTRLEPSWETLYLFLNDVCNLRCRYCRYMNQMPFDKKIVEMDYTVGKRLLDVFVEQSNIRKRRTVVFFGTEVFISFELMKKLIEYIKNISPCSEVVLFTNGTLVDEQKAYFLADMDVKCIVSIDGPKEIHDGERVYGNGKGSFLKVSAGYRTLRESGLTVGISLTVGEHNVDQLDPIIDYFHQNFSPVNVGFNPLESTDKYPKEVYLEKYIEYSMEAYKKARALGISIPQIMHRIRPFVERSLRLKDCPACGGALRAFQNGDFGPCSHFVIDGEDKITFDDIGSFNFATNEVVRRWNDRHTLNLDCYRDCYAAGICGAGCVRNAYLLHGNIKAADDRICVHSRYAIKWLIKDLFNIIRMRKSFLDDGYYVPTAKDRREIYGNIKETDVLPLQEYSKYGELML